MEHPGPAAYGRVYVCAAHGQHRRPARPGWMRGGCRPSNCRLHQRARRLVDQTHLRQSHCADCCRRHVERRHHHRHRGSRRNPHRRLRGAAWLRAAADVGWVRASTRAVSFPHVLVNRARTIQFSGSTWEVKASTIGVTGPGPNYFSYDESDVFVDAQGRLHLRISYHDGRWWSTEVINADPLAYGTYTFTLASRVDQLDPWPVVGLFTWDTGAPQVAYREIDIEHSRWGQPANDNAQFVIQPWDTAWPHASLRRPAPKRRLDPPL